MDLKMSKTLTSQNGVSGNVISLKVDATKVTDS